jgi:hypothetical protein
MKIKWGEQTRHTNYGTFKSGDIRDLPKEVAEDFVAQGLATFTKITEYDKPKKRKTKEE